MKAMGEIPEITLYGAKDTDPCLGLVSFNIDSYKRVALIDTGVGDYSELLSYEKTLKDLFGFEKYPVKGTTVYLEKLFSGPWSDGDFSVIPPHGKL